MRLIIRSIPIVGVVVAVGLLALSIYRYTGDVHWTRVTVSMLCASTLPDGTPNPGRAVPIIALLLFCASMALVYQLISRLAETRVQRDTIQIAGIGSQVYSVLTATPIHNLMVNIALVFTMVAMVAIVYMLHCKHHRGLAWFGVVCIVVALGCVSLYYADALVEMWGVLQKVSSTLTTTWLFAVHLTVKPSKKGESHEASDSR